MSVTPERIAELRARCSAPKMIGHIFPAMLEVLDALTAAQAEIERLREALAAETEALEIALKAVADAHAHWDADQDSKVGKTLIALLDPTLHYRADISRMHAIRARKAAARLLAPGRDET